MALMRLAAAFILCLVASSCTTNAAWRADLIAGREIASVPVAEQRHLDHDLIARVEALRAGGAIQAVERRSAATIALGFVEGDLQDVAWFHNARWVRGIVAVPRIPGGVHGWESECAALGLTPLGYHGRCEHAGRAPAHVYRTAVQGVFVAIADGHVAFLVRTLNPYTRLQLGEREPIEWLGPSRDDPAVTLRSWLNLEQDLRAGHSAADLIATYRLDEVVTDDVRSVLAALASR